MHPNVRADAIERMERAEPVGFNESQQCHSGIEAYFRSWLRRLQFHACKMGQDGAVAACQMFQCCVCVCKYLNSTSPQVVMYSTISHDRAAQTK